MILATVKTLMQMRPAFGVYLHDPPVELEAMDDVALENPDLKVELSAAGHFTILQGEEDALVKVATVKKDNFAMFENFPLHIAVGPKVGRVVPSTLAGFDGLPTSFTCNARLTIAGGSDVHLPGGGRSPGNKRPEEQLMPRTTQLSTNPLLVKPANISIQRILINTCMQEQKVCKNAQICSAIQTFQNIFVFERPPTIIIYNHGGDGFPGVMGRCSLFKVNLSLKLPLATNIKYNGSSV